MITTARLTGLFYLGLAVTGGIAYLLVFSAMFVEGDPAATAARLAGDPGGARLGIALELAAVGCQAAAALWFFALFRRVATAPAVMVAAFGLVNAVALLVATAAWGVANATVTLAADAVVTYTWMAFHDVVWAAGNLFFGLWLIPMGALALRVGMPRALGWLLMGGGIGYTLAAFLGVALGDADGGILDVLTIPATVGELWMLGYLLWGRGRAISHLQPDVEVTSR